MKTLRTVAIVILAVVLLHLVIAINGSNTRHSRRDYWPSRPTVGEHITDMVSGITRIFTQFF